MALAFRNTLTRQKEPFTPIEPGKVRMYTCGPTVYGYAHIGNFRTFIFEDLLRRYLKYKGFEVLQVMNLTDVDDKTIRNSRAEGVSLEAFTNRYTQAFFEDLETLGVERAEVYPRATEHIAEMVAIIRELLAKGIAYELDGNYYYRISAFPVYGRLANLDMQNLKPGARVAADEYEKESVSDFALWKAWDETDNDVYWETELGKGRPGWHIECSAMSMKYLGQHFDIHSGGVDNIFPHHENEIAQSEGATGHKFVNYWLHSEHLIVDGRKMAKSLGNYYTLRDVLAKGCSGLAVRYLLISTHYRQQLNFTFEGLEAAASALERYNDFVSNLTDYQGGQSDGTAASIIAGAREKFETALDDDLNISEALGIVFDFIRDFNRLKAESKLSISERDTALHTFRGFDSVLNFTYRPTSLDAEIEALIRQRTEARARKDFAQADKIRQDLLARGVILEDTAHGVKWKRKL
ncbi:MAG TPA: cysteine--tRNA ligase [Candidatus Deferrimicrobium sp.]|nr:cysteine--tRNA ligase [Candidatus Deferrimicrobium sp.]